MSIVTQVPGPLDRDPSDKKNIEHLYHIQEHNHRTYTSI